LAGLADENDASPFPRGQLKLDGLQPSSSDKSGNHLVKRIRSNTRLASVIDGLNG